MRDSATPPERFFNFQLGSDRKIADWGEIVEYFRLLETQSDRIKIIDMGPSTEGRPFLLVIISSESNLRDLERLRRINLRISDPRGMLEEEAHRLIREGKAIICQSMSLHATEIGGTQMAPELAYDLLSREDEEARRIRENVIFLMIPCFNPDGQVMVTEWYNKWLGTEYEGCSLPWLYHKYVGHDNNRDAFMTNMVESKYVASILFRDWIPQAYVDHHHMGSYGARFYIPPYCEPLHPHADPLVWREHSWYGAHMAYKLEEEGKTGILNGAQFLAWGHLGFHWITNYHNIAGMLTESASAKLATPLFVHYSQLRGEGRGVQPDYEPQTNYPHLWPGGWWRLRDVVEQQKIAAWAVLDIAARNRETILKCAHLKAKRQIEGGEKGYPKVIIVPKDQHDPLTLAKFIEKLLVQGIEVMVAKEDFTAEGRSFSRGSYIIFLSQPKQGLVKTLLLRTRYPDNIWTRDNEGTPLKPQDTATDTLAEFMGIKVVPLNEKVEGDFEKISKPLVEDAKVEGESHLGYMMDCRLNDSYTAVNRLLASGAIISRSSKEIEFNGCCFPKGSFIIEGITSTEIMNLIGNLNISLYPLNERDDGKKPLKQLRIGVYQRYWGGNIDEGWTRWILEQFEFPYATLKDDDFKKGSLKDRFDLIIFPDDKTPFITGEGIEEWWKENRPDMPLPAYPPEYRSGIGKEGVEAIKKFVNDGGTLLAFNNACDFAIEALNLNVENALSKTSPKTFFCPGSTLHANVDTDNSLGYGMPKEILIFFWDSPAFRILPSQYNEKYLSVVTYPDSETLQSGWLIGEERLKRKSAMIVAHIGEGKAVLIGFRVQHRAQTHGTFKLFFNCLFG